MVYMPLDEQHGLGCSVAEQHPSAWHAQGCPALEARCCMSVHMHGRATGFALVIAECTLMADIACHCTSAR